MSRRCSPAHESLIPQHFGIRHALVLGELPAAASWDSSAVSAFLNHFLTITARLRPFHFEPVGLGDADRERGELSVACREGARLCSLLASRPSVGYSERAQGGNR